MQTTTSNSLPEITLYYTDGGSDKVYQASIVQHENDGYFVNFAYGRRGSTLKSGTKTKDPVHFDKAQKIFDKLVSSKTSKGYTPGADGTPYLNSGTQPTGVVPQLLNEITCAHAAMLLEDDEFLAQEKFDGQRMLLIKRDDQISAANKKGLGKSIPLSVAESAAALPNCVLDGEAIGDAYFVFDILELEGDDLRPLPARQRLGVLLDLLRPHATPTETSCSTFPLLQVGAIRLVHTAHSPSHKSELYNRVRKSGGEGIVFKCATAPYVPGRPASGGNMLKYKFYSTATCRVRSHNLVRSVAVEMLEDGNWIPKGNVTIMPSASLPNVGAFIEVRYLYAFRGGSLYQPTYLGQRDDVNDSDCTTTQLKFKHD